MTATGATSTISDEEISQLTELGQQLRVDGIRCSTKAGSGHPTSSMSAADIIAVLASRHLHYDWSRPDNPANDHLIFSKGHASPLLYALYRAVGAISDEELLTYRMFTSRLQGHPTPELPWVDVATGSLGQGLPIAAGVALAGRMMDHLPYTVWTLCGDSELAEGSIWEGLDKAAHYGLSNLVVIFDVNRLGQRGETEFGWQTDVYRARAEAFGCHAEVIDGHSIADIDAALAAAHYRNGRSSSPTVIVARTIKGKGFSEIENHDGWHGKALPPDMAQRAIVELGGERSLHITPLLPEEGAPPAISRPIVKLPTYTVGDKVATRKAYGDALAAVGVRTDVVAMDGEVSNSTYADIFKHHYPDRFFEMFIAEQQLVATAVGMSVRGYRPFASTFAAFFSRAYDFIRMAAISGANIKLVGSHAGVEIGADGPSQMALEDLASLRAIYGSTVLYPSDGTSTAKLVEQMVDRDGVVYMRTTRGEYPVLYPETESFPIGGSKLVMSGPKDEVTIIGAGVTLHLAHDAAKQLASQGTAVRLIDLYSVKPVDVATVKEALAVTGGRLVVVEDHYEEGGLAAAVLEALAGDHLDVSMRHLAVRKLPRSGTPQELFESSGIGTDSIIAAVTDLIAK